jgi:hypothetical protein
MAVLGVEYGAVYTLTGPDGTKAVFNDSSDPNYVGILSPESSGLDSADVRESAQDGTQRDGGVHGDFYYGRRPVVLQGTVIASSKADRAAKIAKIKRASNALRADATLSWPAEGITGGVNVLGLRRQQPVRFTKGWVKDFMIPLVAADAFIYGKLVTESYAYTPPESGLSSQKTTAGTVADAGGGFAWVGVANAKVSDNVYATYTAEGATTSNELKFSNYGFAIPTTALITGVKVEPEIKASVASSAETSDLHIFKTGGSGSVQTDEGVLWPIADSFRAYGNSNNLLGLTLTPAEVNSANFGFGIRVKTNKATVASIDSARITVYYEENGVQHAQTITQNGDAATAPVLKITGRTLASWKATNKTTGKSVTFNGELSTGQVLTLDLKNRTAYLLSGGVTTNVYGFVDFANTNWWELIPGVNELELPPSAKVEVIYRDAYL